MPNAKRPIDGRYSLVRFLGAGGFAEVWLATDAETGGEVALKLPRGRRSDLAGARPTAVREFAAASRLEHPHVVRVLGAGTSEGEPYLVLEYVDGPSLREQLSRGGRLGAAEVAVLAKELCSAIEHAHERGVLHNDIKPENVLLGPDGAKLADFGSAAGMTSTLSATAAGELTASIAYLAPEVLEGERPSVRSDIYSLGLVLYESASGSLPWQGETPAAVAGQRLTQSPPALRELAPGIPLALSAALARALAPLPSDRFESATAFAAAIGATEPTVFIGTLYPARRERTSPPSKGRRMAAAAGVLGSAVAGFGLLAVINSGSGGNPESEPQGTTAPSEARRLLNGPTSTPTPSPTETSVIPPRGGGPPPDRGKPKDEKQKDRPGNDDDEGGDDD